MIRFAVCLLFSTATFAQHYASSGAHSAIPMDFNDDIYNRDMRLPPSSNFVYNFEQARRDQPLQVEMREENLGKYMGRPRTTTPLPVRPEMRKLHVPEVETVHLHQLSDVTPVSMKPYVPQKWDPISSHLPATLPPAPTTPRWMDLSDESFRHHAHHQPTRHPVHQQPMNAYQQPPTPAPIPQWNQPSPLYMNDVQKPEPSYPSNPMPQYMPPSTDYSVPTEHYAHANSQPRSVSRGSHKFSWSDVATPEQAPVVPTTPSPPAVAPQNRGAPSSIPTLTPWYGDAFGK